MTRAGYRNGSSRRLFAAAAAAMLLALGGCVTPFEARVQSFQAMPPIQGQSFVVVPADPQRQGSLEFQSYAALVSKAMAAQGFVPAADPAAAQLQVKMDFGVGAANDRIATRPVPVSSWGWWGRGWGGWPGWWGSFYDPFWGWGSEVYSYTLYPTFLQVAIVDAASQTVLFEGRAESGVRQNDLPATMPKLVDALFTDFPGDRARSKVVRLPAG